MMALNFALPSRRVEMPGAAQQVHVVPGLSDEVTALEFSCIFRSIAKYSGKKRLHAAGCLYRIRIPARMVKAVHKTRHALKRETIKYLEPALFVGDYASLAKNREVPRYR